MFDKKDQEKLAKIGVTSLYDLLLFIPKSYDVNHLSRDLISGTEQLLEVEIHALFRERKRLRITGFLPHFDEPVELIFFNHSRYHHALFKPESRHYLKGKTVLQAGRWQLLQPQIISKIGGVHPRYPCQPLKNNTLISCRDRYLSDSALNTLTLLENHRDSLRLIHFPTTEFAECFNATKTFPASQLESLKYLEACRYLSRLPAKKPEFPAITPLRNGLLESFIDQLPFTPTDDQKNTIEAIRGDLAKNVAARRMIVGDVGCGKTVVILAAAALAYPHRSVLMVPTTILAEQIYQEACKLLPASMRATLALQGTTPDPEAHLLVGTHALLYGQAPDAALVMIDEQHRFGTNQRSLLEQSARQADKRPHLLQFSATPIPRTQAMIESALIDFSFIRQIPFQKQIETRIIGKAGFKPLLQHLHDEIAAGHQAIIVYPLVEESERVNYLSIREGEAFWKQRFERVYVTHGKDREKEQTLREFRESGEILLATTVIEVGISLPKLTTIVIVGAERLGLATLHQLRGRVSRTGLPGWCYLFTNDSSNQRLAEFSETTDGFAIAELDLKYREGGDLLRGIDQSGKSFRFLSLAEDGDIIANVKCKIVSNSAVR